MAFFVNRQMGKGMNSGSEDSASVQVGLLGIGRDMLGIGRDKLGIGRDMLGIGRDELDIGRDMLDTGRDMLGIGRDMLGIYRNKFRCRTCRNYNPHRGRKYLHLWG